MNEIVWEDPPVHPSKNKLDSSWWIPALKELDENPGRWAQVRVCKNISNAGATRHRFIHGENEWDARQYEVTCRTLPSGEGAIYARRKKDQ